MWPPKTSAGLNLSKDMTEKLLPTLFMLYIISVTGFIKYDISNSDFVAFWRTLKTGLIVFGICGEVLVKCSRIFQYPRGKTKRKGRFFFQSQNINSGFLEYLYRFDFYSWNTHITLYTLHSALYTLHSTLYTLHSTLYTLHSTFYYSTLYYSTLYTLPVM